MLTFVEDGGSTPPPPDFIQQAWDNPEANFVIYRDDKNIVLPDQFPVVEYGHTIVASREAVPFDELPPQRQHELTEIGAVITRRLAEEYHPTRGIGQCRWGQQVRTAHTHFFPRFERTDGQAFFSSRERAADWQLATTRARFVRPSTHSEQQMTETLEQEIGRRLGYVAYLG